MKKIFSALVATVALLGSTAASAQTWTPSGSWEFVGDLLMQKGTGPLITCEVKATVDNTTLKTTIAMTGNGDWQCGTVSFTGNPYDTVVTAVNTNAAGDDAITIKNVYVNTSITLGNCKGDLPVTFLDTPDQISVNGTLAPDWGGGSCSVSGLLNKTSPSGPVDIS